MPLHARILAAILWIGGVLTAGAAERNAPARLCPEDAPEGVRLPPRPGCAPTAAKRCGGADADGFHEIGGVKLRIGGRVGAEYGAGR